MPSKLLLALMSAAFAVSTVNAYAEGEEKSENPQVQQIVAEAEDTDQMRGENASLIAEGEKSEGEKADLIAGEDTDQMRGENASLIAEGEKSEGEKADLIAEGEKSEGEKADLIA